MARALVMLGLDLVEERDFASSQSAFEESQALYQDVHDEWGYAHAMMCLGYEFNTQDMLVSALSLYQKALTLFRKLGDRYFICVTVRGVVIAQMKQNNLPSRDQPYNKHWLLRNSSKVSMKLPRRCRGGVKWKSI